MGNILSKVHYALDNSSEPDLCIIDWYTYNVPYSFFYWSLMFEGSKAMVLNGIILAIYQ